MHAVTRRATRKRASRWGGVLGQELEAGRRDADEDRDEGMRRPADLGPLEYAEAAGRRAAQDETAIGDGGQGAVRAGGMGRGDGSSLIRSRREDGDGVVGGSDATGLPDVRRRDR